MKKINIQFFILFFILAFWANYVIAEGFKDKLSLGFNVNTQKLFGDTHVGRFVYGVTPILFRYNLKPYAFLESNLGFGQLPNLKGGLSLESNMISLGVKAGYRFLYQDKINPLIYVGIGIFNFRLLDNLARYWDGYGAVGGGIEVFLMDNVGLNITGDFRYTTGDDFDGNNSRIGKDSFINLSLGLVFYMGGREGFTSKPIFTDQVPEEFVPVEEVAVDRNILEENPSSNETTENLELVKLLSKRDELLKLKKEKEDIIKLFRIKLISSDKQLENLEQKLKKRAIDSLNISYMFEEKEDDFFIKRYQIGLSYFEVGNYEEAIITFIGLLNENLDNFLATNCWYWLGESYYSLQDYDSAIEAFQVVLKGPNSLKREASLLMLGLSRWKQGNLSQARANFKRLLESYPNSLYMPLTKRYLAEISS